MRQQSMTGEIVRGIRREIEHSAVSVTPDLPENLQGCIADGFAIYQQLASPEVQTRNAGTFDFRDECARYVVWSAAQGFPEDMILNCFAEPDVTFIQSVISAVERLRDTLQAELSDLLPEPKLAASVRQALGERHNECV